VLVEIAPTIFLVEGEKRGQFPFSHSILIRDEVTTLIDTGCGVDRLQRLREKYQLDLVINSHAHPDHISGNWLFSGLPLWVPRQSFNYCGRITEMSERFTGSKALAQKWREYIRNATEFRDAPPTNSYEDGHRFRLGSVELQAIHCPGHTSDSYCLLAPRRNILFSFDIELSRFGPWYGHPDSDIAQFEASIRRVRDLKPQIIVSSHVGIIEDRIEERLQRYLDFFAQRDRRILEFLSHERRLEEMVEQPLIYHDFPYAPELLRLWHKNMLQKHLKRLERRGLVRRTGEGYIRNSGE
jgi:glyoxylase-like metal-dependent hydrolase (beta-lactamase superfamily II)